MIHSVAKCPKCPNLQMITLTDLDKAILRCLSCRKQTKIKSADGSFKVQIHGTFETPKEASLLCQKIKEKRAGEKFYYEFSTETM